jgi:hypothetical protein
VTRALGPEPKNAMALFIAHGSRDVRRASRVPCKNSIGIATSRTCLARSSDGASDGMQRESEEREAPDPGQWRFGLCCDGHAAPNDLPPATRGLGKFRRVRVLGALLHIGKLIAQCGDATLREPVRDGRHKRV